MSKVQRDPQRETEFALWLVKLGAGCRQEIDDLTQETYTEALCYQIDPETWAAYVRESNTCGRYQWFPKLHELLEDLHEFRTRQTAPTERMIPAAVDDEWYQTVEEKRAAARENARQGLQLVKAAYAKAMAETPAPPPTPKAPTIPDPTPDDDAKREERIRILKQQAAALTDEAVTPVGSEA